MWWGGLGEERRRSPPVRTSKPLEWHEVLIQQTVNGVTRGAVFALIALGYTMVYGIIGLINFAHGDVFMLGLFISLSYFALLGMVTTLHGWQLVTVLPLVFLVTTIPLMIALQYFVTRTRWGKAMRATAQDKETALALGIDVEKTIILTFFIGGALAGAAGLIQGLYYNIGMWWMGYQAGLRAFTAAVLGGIGSMPGAALGGLVIGFLSAWSDQYISARWTNAIVFTILILVLVFRPQGLLGERVPDKA